MNGRARATITALLVGAIVLGLGADTIYGDVENGVGGNFGTDDWCNGGGGTDTCNSTGYPYYCETRNSCEIPA